MSWTAWLASTTDLSSWSETASNLLSTWMSRSLIGSIPLCASMIALMYSMTPSMPAFASVTSEVALPTSALASNDRSANAKFAWASVCENNESNWMVSSRSASRSLLLSSSEARMLGSWAAVSVSACCMDATESLQLAMEVEAPSS